MKAAELTIPSSTIVCYREAIAASPMPKLLITKLSRTTLNRLKSRAAEQGTTAEIEARSILEKALARPNLADVAARLFGPKHGIVLDIPARHRMRPPPSFG